MLLPFDLRADGIGWTVLDVRTDKPAVLDDLQLVGLACDEAENAVNALNALEISSERVARRRVLGEAEDPR
jgi:hypothetical protein